jgi:hypothetical protein
LRRTRIVRTALGASAAAALLLIALQPAATASAASSDITPSIVDQNSSCPLNAQAIVPKAASLRSNGVKALIPAEATAATAAAMESNPVLLKAAAQGARWVTDLGCKATNLTAKLPDQTNSVMQGTGTQYTTSNWSGYQWSGIDANHAYYNQAYMSWVVPTAQSGVSTTQRHESIWPGVGTGNSRDDDLAQAGTETVAGPLGAQQTYGFFEAYPTQPTEVQVSSLTIHAGDDVAAIVTINAANTVFWQLCDYTSNVCASAKLTLSYNTSSSNYGGVIGQDAEWIIERTGLPTGHSELGNFGTITISGAHGRQVVGAGTSSELFSVNGLKEKFVTKKQIAMKGCDGTLLTSYPTTPDVDGTFKLTWKNYGKLDQCP